MELGFENVNERKCLEIHGNKVLKYWKVFIFCDIWYSSITIGQCQLLACLLSPILYCQRASRAPPECCITLQHTRWFFKLLNLEADTESKL